jgi:hypothetical protein
MQRMILASVGKRECRVLRIFSIRDRLEVGIASSLRSTSSIPKRRACRVSFFFADPNTRSSKSCHSSNSIR